MMSVWLMEISWKRLERSTSFRVGFMVAFLGPRWSHVLNLVPQSMLSQSNYGGHGHEAPNTREGIAIITHFPFPHRYTSFITSIYKKKWVPHRVLLKIISGTYRSSVTNLKQKMNTPYKSYMKCLILFSILHISIPISKTKEDSFT